MKRLPILSDDPEDDILNSRMDRRKDNVEREDRIWQYLERRMHRSQPNVAARLPFYRNKIAKADSLIYAQECTLGHYLCKRQKCMTMDSHHEISWEKDVIQLRAGMDKNFPLLVFSSPVFCSAMVLASVLAVVLSSEYRKIKPIATVQWARRRRRRVWGPAWHTLGSFSLAFLTFLFTTAEDCHRKWMP